MKTHLIVDTFFCVGDVLFVGTWQQCKDLEVMYGGTVKIEELTEQEKQLYN